jgi:hypothetical protein
MSYYYGNVIIITGLRYEGVVSCYYANNMITR